MKRLKLRTGINICSNSGGNQNSHKSFLLYGLGGRIKTANDSVVVDVVLFLIKKKKIVC